MMIITESITYKGIPTLLSYPADSKNLPLIIFCHGFSNDRFEGSHLSMKLALQGFSVLSFDGDRHGQRYDGFMDHIEDDLQVFNALFRCTENTFEDLKVLIEVLRDHKVVDVTKLGLVGYSLGANICNYALANDLDLKACVSILGSPCFVDLLKYSLDKESDKDFTTKKEIDLLNYVKDLDPVDKLISSKIDTPWLMINARKDDSIPMTFSQGLYDKVKDIWHGPIDYKVEDEFHHVSDTMIDETCLWFKSYML